MKAEAMGNNWYILTDKNDARRLKIGFTRRTATQRVVEIRQQAGLDMDIAAEGTILGCDAVAIEAAMREALIRAGATEDTKTKDIWSLFTSQRQFTIDLLAGFIENLKLPAVDNVVPFPTPKPTLCLDRDNIAIAWPALKARMLEILTDHETQNTDNLEVISYTNSLRLELLAANTDINIIEQLDWVWLDLDIRMEDDDTAWFLDPLHGHNLRQLRDWISKVATLLIQLHSAEHLAVNDV